MQAKPTGFLASYYCISKAEYLAWHQAGYSVTCGERMQAGMPCKNVVEGGAGVEPQQWVALHGGNCHLHH